MATTARIFKLKIRSHRNRPPRLQVSSEPEQAEPKVHSLSRGVSQEETENVQPMSSTEVIDKAELSGRLRYPDSEVLPSGRVATWVE